ncbi:hypothetical protein NQZ79_g3165 [Umbelopsis isabellina]|nr:hypothetical protein NQZ79_g3165 [Umbelopsis isabellina]
MPIRTRQPFVTKVQVLVPKILDIQTIQKCPIDYDCELTALDNKAVSERSGHTFVVYQEKFFIVHLNGQEVKCDYNCRNRVMTFIRRYSRFEQQKLEDLFDKKFELDFTDGVVRNNHPPLMIFSNEKPLYFKNSFNTVIGNYSSINIQQLTEITKRKPCRQDYFLIYLGEKELLNICRTCNKIRKKMDARYVCCSMKTLESYEYSYELKARVDQMLYEDVDACIATLKAEDEAAELLKPAKRIANFRLTDIAGNPVEENIDYYLQLYNEPEDVLKIRNYSNTFYATYRLNRSEKIIVRYIARDAIHYLTYKNQILQGVCSQDEIGFDKELPGKNGRLKFHVTENNTFKIVQWDDDIWLTFEKHTLCNSSITFTSKLEFVRVPKPLELSLKKV